MTIPYVVQVPAPTSVNATCPALAMLRRSAEQGTLSISTTRPPKSQFPPSRRPLAAGSTRVVSGASVFAAPSSASEDRP